MKAFCKVARLWQSLRTSTSRHSKREAVVRVMATFEVIKTVGHGNHLPNTNAQSILLTAGDVLKMETDTLSVGCSKQHPSPAGQVATKFGGV